LNNQQSHPKTKQNFINFVYPSSSIHIQEIPRAKSVDKILMEKMQSSFNPSSQILSSVNIQNNKIEIKSSRSVAPMETIINQ
jgi:hypothetical protein